MPVSRPLQKLAQGTGTGLRELPSNAAWLLSQMLPTEELQAMQQNAVSGQQQLSSCGDAHIA